MVRWAFNNRLQPIARIGEFGDYELPLTMEQEGFSENIFVAEFAAAGDGEFFLFANDVMPLPHLAPFYTDNLGTAKVTLRKTHPNGKGLSNEFQETLAPTQQ